MCRPLVCTLDHSATLVTVHVGHRPAGPQSCCRGCLVYHGLHGARRICQDGPWVTHPWEYEEKEERRGLFSVVLRRTRTQPSSIPGGPSLGWRQNLTGKIPVLLGHQEKFPGHTLFSIIRESSCIPGAHGQCQPIESWSRRKWNCDPRVLGLFTGRVSRTHWSCGLLPGKSLAALCLLIKQEYHGITPRPTWTDLEPRIHIYFLKYYNSNSHNLSCWYYHHWVAEA